MASDEIIFLVVSKIRIVSVVNGKTIFHAVLNVSIVSDEIVFHAVLNVSVVSDETVFPIILNVGVVSLVSYETILDVLSKINLLNNKCILMCILAKQHSQCCQYRFHFCKSVCKTA